MLSQIRYRNIVKLYGFCLYHLCMFLAYEYMGRGSLFYALNMDDEELRIHKDVSRNNILLNSELHVLSQTLELLDFLILILQIRHYKLEHMGTLHQSRPSMQQVAHELSTFKQSLSLLLAGITIHQLIA
ncbi:hypothetical protein Ahy_B06g084567 [Arachis hypogaea]|uniref:non-specific serine/threonine protein kinase n=1 Tax=Arachis hypogaea TaxID=3818 RepID=A0A444YS85_ARAHY|nr:hypothetical protein Ahy_B06g084567 [Arachis hypogaea]